jgi:hypothetical protein
MNRLAEDHARNQYTGGELRRLRNCQANLENRSYQVVSCGNGVALAGTALAGYEGIFETPSGHTMVLTPGFDRAGAAVVEGPTGRLVVIILAG